MSIDNKSDKPMESNDASQTLGEVYNRVDKSLSTSTFITGLAGRKITVTYPTATTELYAYSENSDALYSILVTYTDSTKDNISTIERTV